MRRITKRFGATAALEAVDFDVRAGEVHALVGENGAGKSTLMNVLAGRFADYGGSITFAGKPVRMTCPRQARLLGIRVIHQDRSVIGNFTVAENIILGDEPAGRWTGRLNRKAIAAAARAVIDRIGFDLNCDEVVGGLGTARQTLVEIAAALHRNAKLLVFDEPTASLGSDDVERLFRVIRDLRRKGLGIVYISHRLAELPRIADRVTVLRDGRVAGTRPMKSFAIAQLSEMMLGRRLGEMFGARKNRPGEIVLQVRDLSGPGISRPVSFDLREGEIMGIAGLVGSGRTEIARALFGAVNAGGSVSMAGRTLPWRRPHLCRRAGIGMIPENRKSQGIISGRPLAENLNIAILERLSGRLGFLRRNTLLSSAASTAGRMCIQPPEPLANIDMFSGGNQQKAVLGRWLAANPSVLILDEPTQGIDVGTKNQIYGLIAELAESGCAVILISSEFIELARLCNRVLVLRAGRLKQQLSADGITAESLFEACLR